MSESPFYIGALSGTSLDAIDVALVSFKKTVPELIQTLNHPIPSLFRERCLQISRSGLASIDDYGQLDAEAGELFAEAVLSLLKITDFSAEQIHAIGSHGQNLRHQPEAKHPFSLQIGDPNIIAERTGILTIADFRRRDIAAGGQGAPLAPGFHAKVFRSTEEDRVILNIGGISNITCLFQDPQKPILGFDTGPGNCLMDLWAQKNWGLSYDKDGLIARQGRIHSDLLNHCLRDPYFSKIPPKSTGIEYFNETWFLNQLKIIPDQDYSVQDIQATLLALTVESISQAILDQIPKVSAVYVCGGGAHNLYLLESLGTALSRPVYNTAALGLPPAWIEAILFAWLAKQTLEGKPGNCRSVTGAKQAIPLGAIFGTPLNYRWVLEKLL